MTERTISRHFTRGGADRRIQDELAKMKLPGHQSSGWARRKFMIRSTGSFFRRWKVVER